jgi:type II secretory pathway pseudopilin PulG
MPKRISTKGFTLLEAVLIMFIIGSAFFSFGYLFGNLDQEALDADLTVIATKVARQKLEQLIQTKADSGYAAITNSGPTTVTVGTWNFTLQVTTSSVNPSDMSASVVETGYKKVVISVSWAAGGGNSISLTTLFGNMVPSAVPGV